MKYSEIIARHAEIKKLAREARSSTKEVILDLRNKANK